MSQSENIAQGRYLTVTHSGEDVDSLVRRIKHNGWFVSADAFSIIDAMRTLPPPPRGEAALHALSPDDIAQRPITTAAVQSSAAQRNYLLPDVWDALCLATQYPTHRLRALSIVVMHRHFLVRRNNRLRERCLAINLGRDRPALVAPRLDSEFPWDRGEIFVYRSPLS